MVSFVSTGFPLSRMLRQLNNFRLFGRLAQLGERQVRNLEVRGSIPLSSTKVRESLLLQAFPNFFAV